MTNTKNLARNVKNVEHRIDIDQETTRILSDMAAAEGRSKKKQIEYILKTTAEAWKHEATRD